jgi:ribosomal protein S18 acetylase RimI-like enzyme
MHRDDTSEAASIHSQQFARQRHSENWVSCNFAAFPRIMMFVARNEKDRVIGYIQWIQKSGFRQNAVIELEQIAVYQDYQGIGIEETLIRESLSSVRDYLSDSHSQLKAILVTTGAENKAQELYKNTLDAKVVAVIKGLYAHDEVTMMAKDV